MAFQIRPDIDPPEEKSDAGSFSLSADPVVANAAGETISPEGAAAGLPSTYGSQALHLMPRDPHSLFAYWDIDWAAAFGDEPPRDRKVHLRVSNSEGKEEISIEVEPMAGSCYVTVREADANYSAELGYFEPASTWKSVAASEAVQTPPDVLFDSTAVDFATVPYHLSFQKMIDLFRVSKHESGSLTERLTELHERATPQIESGTFTPEEREIVRAIDEALVDAPASSVGESVLSDDAVQQHLDRILGLGNSGATSPAGGFGGSSHAFGS